MATTQNPVPVVCPQEVWTLISADLAKVRFSVSETRVSYAVTFVQPGAGPPVGNPGPVYEKIQTLAFRLDVCSGVDFYAYVYKGQQGVQGRLLRYACAEV